MHTESGIIVSLPDDFNALVQQLNDFNANAMTPLRNRARDYYLQPQRRNAIAAQRTSSGNLAVGRVHLILKDGRFFTKDISITEGGIRGFLSGSFRLFSDAQITRNGQNIITDAGNAFYFCDSDQAGQTQNNHALNWFRSLINRDREFYRYTYDRPAESIDNPTKERLKAVFFHSEEALALYVRRNKNEILRIPATAGGGNIAIADIQVMIVDIVTERDMCDNCFKTMAFLSRDMFEGINTVFRVVGTQPHIVGAYNSRTTTGRAATGKQDLETFDFIPNLKFILYKIYVKIEYSHIIEKIS